MRIGRGGEQLVAQITGLSGKTIHRGRRELNSELAERAVGRVRAMVVQPSRSRIRHWQGHIESEPTQVVFHN